MENWLSGPPPRFAVESDESNSEFEDPGAGPVPPTRVKRASRSPPVLKTQWSGLHQSACYIAIGAPGQAWSRGLINPETQQEGTVDLDGKVVSPNSFRARLSEQIDGGMLAQVAGIFRINTSSTVVLVTSTLSYEASHPVAESLLTSLKPAS